MNKNKNIIPYKNLPTNIPSPSDFSSYSRFAYNYPTLNEYEERVLVKEYKENNSKEAVIKLILSHLKLVIKIVKEHSGYGLDRGDLAQEGTVGLMKAIKKFNPKLNVRLATYAIIWIRGQIREFILENLRLVKLGGKNAKKLFFKFKQLTISGKNEFSEKEKFEAENYFSGNDISIYDNDSKRDFSNESFYNKLEYKQNKNTKNIDEDLNSNLSYSALTSGILSPEENLIKNENLTIIAKILNQNFDERTNFIIKERILSDKPIKLSVIADKFDISIERARQLETQAIKEIKEKYFI